MIGRNQCKWYPDWLGTSDPYKGLGGRLVEKPQSSRHVIVDQVPAKDAEDKPILDAKGKPVMKNVISRVFACPCCGTVVCDRKGLPVSAKAISNNKMTCEGRYLRQIADPGLKKQHGRDRRAVPSRFRDKKVGGEVNIGGQELDLRGILLDTMESASIVFRVSS